MKSAKNNSGQTTIKEGTERKTWSVPYYFLIRTKLILGFIQRFQVAINRVVGVVLIVFGGSLAFEESR